MEDVIFGSNTPERAAAAATASHKSWWTLSRECHVKTFFWSSEVLRWNGRCLPPTAVFLRRRRYTFAPFFNYSQILPTTLPTSLPTSLPSSLLIFLYTSHTQKKKFDILLCRCLLGTKLFFLPLLSIVSHPTITSRLPFIKKSWVPVKTLR